jgi:hypothetical protein
MARHRRSIAPSKVAQPVAFVEIKGYWNNAKAEINR